MKALFRNKNILKTILVSVFAAMSLVGSFHFASAHEAYVLPADRFQEGLHQTTTNPFASLFDASHLKLTIIITICVVLAFLLNFLIAASKTGERLSDFVKKAGAFGPLLIRFVVGISFFYSARSQVVFGPELQLSVVPHGQLILFLEFALSIMFIFGAFTEFAAAIAIAIYFYLFGTFHAYMLTYANYFGEFLVLVVFGSRFLSIDRLLFGAESFWKKARQWTYLEVPVVRVLYGVALIYAGYTIKFAHQQLTIDVYNQYHLEYFFHATGAFIAAGAGVSEIAIGLLILLGFGVRLTVLISLVFITLSLSYFHELLWPHYLLYGISISLLINAGGAYSLDKPLINWIKRYIYGSR